MKRIAGLGIFNCYGLGWVTFAAIHAHPLTATTILVPAKTIFALAKTILTIATTIIVPAKTILTLAKTILTPAEAILTIATTILALATTILALAKAILALATTILPLAKAVFVLAATTLGKIPRGSTLFHAPLSVSQKWDGLRFDIGTMYFPTSFTDRD